MSTIAMKKSTRKKHKHNSKDIKKSKINESVSNTIPEDEIIEKKITNDNDNCKINKKKGVNIETISNSFDEILLCIENQIQFLREEQTKTKGVKFLRSLNKKIKLLRNQNSRVLKQKTKTKRKNNKNSGFLKPVVISNEMANFTGWDKKELRSRVEVTKYICNYIKEHDLQNPSDRRQIKPDKKLQKLLNFNPKHNKEPLRYYSLQTYLKPHFPKKKITN